MSNIPLIIDETLSSGRDPFESVRKCLSNGTLDREKIFEKVKISQHVKIGSKQGSSFGPYKIRPTQGDRTASHSYDSATQEKVATDERQDEIIPPTRANSGEEEVRAN